MTVLIAGGGIAGLSLGLTLHQIGIPFRIFETSREMKPLGVGINIQPNAVRELLELGLENELDQVGIKTQEYGFFTKTGKEIWTEPRGMKAGYAWPQYSVHRGRFQMALHKALMDRAGADCFVTGKKATGFRQADNGAVLLLQDTESGTGEEVQGRLIIGADGIHSAIRGQMQPQEGAPKWSGAVLWRATSHAKPFCGGAAMALAGHAIQRIVAYPIAPVDEKTGLQEINWIAEISYDPNSNWKREDWNRQADIEDFLPSFQNWKFDWLDVPSLITSANAVFEYPMVDRDALDHWTNGAVTLMGDAAHPLWPVGSNGASQAIIDARVIGGSLLEFGCRSEALQAYEQKIRPTTTAILQANRSGGGPDGIMQVVEDLCEGEFDKVTDVISYEDLSAHAAKYKKLAGFSIEELNASPPIISLDKVED